MVLNSLSMKVYNDSYRKITFYVIHFTVKGSSKKTRSIKSKETEMYPHRHLPICGYASQSGGNVRVYN